MTSANRAAANKKPAGINAGSNSTPNAAPNAPASSQPVAARIQAVPHASPSPVDKAPATEPRLRDADRSREAILAAARDEFAAHGLGGARVERIAERAGVNKRLLYYYYDDKDTLFRAVLEDAYLQIRAAEQQLHLTDLPPAEALRKLTEFTWNYYLAHPEFLTLLNSENLHRGRHLQGSASRAQALNSPLIKTLGEILERGRSSGVFRGGVDPLQLYISIAGLSYFYLSNNHTLSAIFNRDLMSPKARNERLSHMCDVILGYVLRD